MLYRKYMSSVSQFINILYCWIYCNYTLHKKLNKSLQEPEWPFVSFWNIKSLFITCSHLFSFLNHLLSLAVILCHSLPFVVTRCHSLSFVVTSCHFLYHLSLFIVPLAVIRFHSMYHSSVFFQTINNSIAIRKQTDSWKYHFFATSETYYGNKIKRS